MLMCPEGPDGTVCLAVIGVSGTVPGKYKKLHNEALPWLTQLLATKSIATTRLMSF